MVRLKDKFIAAGIHLLISIVVALFVIALLVFYWFPGSLIELGAIQGAKIMLIVDLVLGPVCTFVVYKKLKSSLKFDLSVIALIQIGALIYGLITVHSQKPSYLVLTYSDLTVVSHLDEELLLENEEYSAFSELQEHTLKFEGRIPVILLQEAEDIAMRRVDKVAFEITSGLPYVLFFERYVAINSLNSAAPMLFGSIQLEGGCYSVMMSSSHGSKRICIQEVGGGIVEK